MTNMIPADTHIDQVVAPNVVKPENGNQKNWCRFCQISVPRFDMPVHLKGKKHLNKVFQEKVKEGVKDEGILVSGFSSELPITSILKYFKKYGIVVVFFLNESNNEILIQYAKKYMAENVLKASHHKLSGFSLKVKSRRHCPVENNLKGVNVDNFKNIIGESIKTLKKHEDQNLEDQIKLLVSMLEAKAEEENEHKRICQSLEKFFSITFPGCSIHTFGSSVAGLAFVGSDIDLHLNLPQGLMTTENSKQYVGKKINDPLLTASRLLRAHPEVTEMFYVKSARIPVVKFVFNGISCDLTSNNMIGIHNSNLLRILQSFDWRIKPFLFILKCWAKFHRVCASLSSYALCLMAVFYLQQLNPPILPTVEALQCQVPAEQRRLINNWNVSFSCSVPSFDAAKNSSSIIELVLGFFEYFGKLEFENRVLCPLIGATLDKAQFSSCDQAPACMASYFQSVAAGMNELKIRQLNIQDPFELNFNPTFSVVDFAELQGQFLKARDICQHVINDKSKQKLSSLFLMAKPPQHKKTMDIKIKFKTHMPLEVKQMESYLNDVGVFLGSLFTYSYLITILEAEGKSPKRQKLSESDVLEGSHKEMPMKWQEKYLLQVPFDLWKGRNDKAAELDSATKPQTVLEQESAVTTLLNVRNDRQASEPFASLVFTMKYDVATSTVHLTFENESSPVSRLRSFTEGLRRRLVSVMRTFCFERNLPITPKISI